jgi:hypothetical protein
MPRLAVHLLRLTLLIAAAYTAYHACRLWRAYQVLKTLRVHVLTKTD